MNDQQWWVIGWSTVSVLAGTVLTAMAPQGERASTALWFAGVFVGIWSGFGALVLLGWWPR